MRPAFAIRARDRLLIPVFAIPRYAFCRLRYTNPYLPPRELTTATTSLIYSVPMEETREPDVVSKPEPEPVDEMPKPDAIATEVPLSERTMIALIQERRQIT